MKTYSQTQRNYIAEGANQDNILRRWARKSLGLEESRVTSKRHCALSGPPGVGKTFSIMEEIRNSGAKHIVIGPGSTVAAISAKLAYGVHTLKEDEELIVLKDDADDVVFADKTTMNQWKLAYAKYDPVYTRDVDLTSTISKYEKMGRHDLIAAIQAFQEPGEIGIHIPLDRVRFIIICNSDLEDLKSFHPSKRPHVEAVLDRLKYRKLDFEWKVNWGWLAYILQNSQPFADVGIELDDEQKARICSWLWDKWENMRNPSYRTIEEMAEYMIEEPDSYEDEWEKFLRSR